MEGEIKNIKKYFNEVTSKFDELSFSTPNELGEAFEALGNALYHFDGEFDYFLEGVKNFKEEK